MASSPREKYSIAIPPRPWFTLPAHQYQAVAKPLEPQSSTGFESSSRRGQQTMKRIFLTALIGAVMVAAIFQVLSGSKAARTPDDYPLVCRGGGSLVIGVASGEGNIGFVFTRGTKPAAEGLAPGECSWTDRGMYASEPDKVSQHFEGSENLKVGGTLAPEYRWYEELHSPDKYWTFQVSNNGRGQLIATSARPNGVSSKAGSNA